MDKVDLELKIATDKADAAMAASAKRGRDLFEKKGFNLNLKGGNLPLGRITGDFDKFSGSLDAATARVLAFTATTTVVYGLSTAFSRLFSDSIKLEKQLASIQAILQTSNSNLQKFSSDLFALANATGQSFDVAAAAASEFARQGLSVAETLKATNAALVFSKIAGVDAAQAVENLTASINTFGNEALSYTDVVDTIVSLDNAFAISAGGIADGLKRVGSVASESGIQLKEIASLISVVQQVSARGAPVISNGLKTIFTRLSRTSVQETLNSIGIATQTSNGEFRSQIDVLTDLSNKLDSLSDSQKAFVLEQVAGVYQINTLQATLKSLNGEYSLFDKAVKVASDSSGNAAERLKILTNTTDASLQKLKNNLTQFLAETGRLTVKPILDNFVGLGNKILETLNLGAAAEGGEKAGFSIGKVLLNGISSALSGPGSVLLVVGITKLLTKITKDALTAVQTLAGLKKASIVDEKVQMSVNKAIEMGNKALVARLATTTSLVEKSRILQTLMADMDRKQGMAQINQAVSAGLKANKKIIPPKGKTKAEGFIPTYSRGFIPDSMQRLEKKGAMAGGYSPKKVIAAPDSIGGVMNKAESLVSMRGMKQPFINPPKNSKAGRKHRKKAIRETGIDPYALMASGGFIPNFALAKNVLKRADQLGPKVIQRANPQDTFQAIVNPIEMNSTVEDLRKKSKDILDKVYVKTKDRKAGEKAYNEKGLKDFENEYSSKSNKALLNRTSTFVKNIGTKGNTLRSNSSGYVYALRQIQGLLGEVEAKKSLKDKSGKTKFTKGFSYFDLVTKNEDGSKSFSEVRARAKVNSLDILKKAANQDVLRKNYNNKVTDNVELGNYNVLIPKGSVFNSSGFVPNFASRYTEGRKQKRDQLKASLFNIGDFAGGAIKNINAQTEFNQARDKNPNIEFDDKINQVGFKVERIPILDKEFEAALRSKNNNKEVTTKFENYSIDYLNRKGYSFKAGRNTLYGKENASVDGYNIRGNFIELLEVKGGGWDTPDVSNKFGRFAPENLVDLAPELVSKFFKEGDPNPNVNDKIRIQNVLAIPALTGGVFKKNIAGRYPSADLNSMEKARQKKTGKKIPAKYAWMEGLINQGPVTNSSGFIPNFAVPPRPPIDLAYNPAHKARQKKVGGLRNRRHQVSALVETLITKLPQSYLSNKVLGDAIEGSGVETEGIFSNMARIPQFLASFGGPKAIDFVHQVEQKGMKVSKSLVNKLSRKAANVLGPKYNAEGFIPNFSPYAKSVMGLEERMSGKKAVLDYKSGFGPFIRNTGQRDFADAIADHGGLKKAMGDSMAGQQGAGLVSGGFIPNFARRRRRRRRNNNNNNNTGPNSPNSPNAPDNDNGQQDLGRLAKLGGIGFGLSSLTGMLSTPEEGKDPTPVQKAIGIGGEAIGAGFAAGAVASSVPILAPLAPAIGIGVAAFKGLKGWSDATIPSLTKLTEANDKLVNSTELEIASIAEVVKAQDEISQLKESGGDPKKIARAQLQFAKSLNRIKDTNLAMTLSTEKDDNKKQEAILAYQEKIARDLSFSQGNLATQNIIQQSQKENSSFLDPVKGLLGMGGRETKTKDFKVDDWNLFLNPIIDSLDFTKDTSGKAAEALKKLGDGSSNFGAFISEFGQTLGMSQQQVKMATDTYNGLNNEFKGPSIDAMNKYSAAFINYNRSIIEAAIPEQPIFKMDFQKVFDKALKNLTIDTSLANYKQFSAASSNIAVERNRLDLAIGSESINESESITRGAELQTRELALTTDKAGTQIISKAVDDLTKLIPKKATAEQRSGILDQAKAVLQGGGNLSSLEDLIKKTLDKDKESLDALELIANINDEVVVGIEQLRIDQAQGVRSINAIAQDQLKEIQKRSVAEIGRASLAGEPKYSSKLMDVGKVLETDTKIQKLRSQAERAGGATTEGGRKLLVEALNLEKANNRIKREDEKAQAERYGQENVTKRVDEGKSGAIQIQENMANDIGEKLRGIQSANRKKGGGGIFSNQDIKKITEGIQIGGEGAAQSRRMLEEKFNNPVFAEDPVIQNFIKEIKKVGGANSIFSDNAAPAAGAGMPAIPSGGVAGTGMPAIPSARGAEAGVPAIPSVAGAGAGMPAIPSVAGAGAGMPAIPSIAGAGAGMPAIPSVGAALTDTSSVGSAQLPSWQSSAAGLNGGSPERRAESARALKKAAAIETSQDYAALKAEEENLKKLRQQKGLIAAAPQETISNNRKAVEGLDKVLNVKEGRSLFRQDQKGRYTQQNQFTKFAEKLSSNNPVTQTEFENIKTLSKDPILQKEDNAQAKKEIDNLIAQVEKSGYVFAEDLGSVQKQIADLKATKFKNERAGLPVKDIDNQIANLEARQTALTKTPEQYDKEIKKSEESAKTIRGRIATNVKEADAIAAGTAYPRDMAERLMGGPKRPVIKEKDQPENFDVATSMNLLEKAKQEKDALEKEIETNASSIKEMEASRSSESTPEQDKALVDARNKQKELIAKRDAANVDIKEGEAAIGQVPKLTQGYLEQQKNAIIPDTYFEDKQIKAAQSSIEYGKGVGRYTPEKMAEEEKKLADATARKEAKRGKTQSTEGYDVAISRLRDELANGRTKMGTEGYLKGVFTKTALTEDEKVKTQDAITELETVKKGIEESNAKITQYDQGIAQADQAYLTQSPLDYYRTAKAEQEKITPASDKEDMAIKAAETSIEYGKAGGKYSPERMAEEERKLAAAKAAKQAKAGKVQSTKPYDTQISLFEDQLNNGKMKIGAKGERIMTPLTEEEKAQVQTNLQQAKDNKANTEAQNAKIVQSQSKQDQAKARLKFTDPTAYLKLLNEEDTAKSKEEDTVMTAGKQSEEKLKKLRTERDAIQGNIQSGKDGVGKDGAKIKIPLTKEERIAQEEALKLKNREIFDEEINQKLLGAQAPKPDDVKARQKELKSAEDRATRLDPVKMQNAAIAKLKESKDPNLQAVGAQMESISQKELELKTLGSDSSKEGKEKSDLLKKQIEEEKQKLGIAYDQNRGAIDQTLYKDQVAPMLAEKIANPEDQLKVAEFNDKVQERQAKEAELDPVNKKIADIEAKRAERSAVAKEAGKALTGNGADNDRKRAIFAKFTRGELTAEEANKESGGQLGAAFDRVSKNRMNKQAADQAKADLATSGDSMEERARKKEIYGKFSRGEITQAEADKQTGGGLKAAFAKVVPDKNAPKFEDLNNVGNIKEEEKRKAEIEQQVAKAKEEENTLGAAIKPLLDAVTALTAAQTATKEGAAAGATTEGGAAAPSEQGGEKKITTNSNVNVTVTGGSLTDAHVAQLEQSLKAYSADSINKAFINAGLPAPNLGPPETTAVA